MTRVLFLGMTLPFLAVVPLLVAYGYYRIALSKLPPRKQSSELYLRQAGHDGTANNGPGRIEN